MMIEYVAADDTDFRVGQEVSSPEIPTQERQAGEHGLRLADRAIERHGERTEDRQMIGADGFSMRLPPSRSRSA